MARGNCVGLSVSWCRINSHHLFYWNINVKITVQKRDHTLPRDFWKKKLYPPTLRTVKINIPNMLTFQKPWKSVVTKINTFTVTGSWEHIVCTSHMFSRNKANVGFGFYDCFSSCNLSTIYILSYFKVQSCWDQKIHWL